MEIRQKIFRSNNPALIRITNLILKTEEYIQEKSESIQINETKAIKKNEEKNYLNLSFELKDKNYDSTQETNSNNYKSNLTFYSSKSDEKATKEKKFPKFVDFRGLS